MDEFWNVWREFWFFLRLFNENESINGLVLIDFVECYAILE